MLYAEKKFVFYIKKILKPLWKYNPLIIGDSSSISKVELINTEQLPSKQGENLAKASYVSDKFLLVQGSREVSDWPVAHHTNISGFSWSTSDYSFYSVTWWCKPLVCWSLTVLCLRPVHSKDILMLYFSQQLWSHFHSFNMLLLQLWVKEGRCWVRKEGLFWKIRLCFDDYQIFELLLPRWNSCSCYCALVPSNVHDGLYSLTASFNAF